MYIIIIIHNKGNDKQFPTGPHEQIKYNSLLGHPSNPSVDCSHSVYGVLRTKGYFQLATVGPIKDSFCNRLIEPSQHFT